VGWESALDLVAFSIPADFGGAKCATVGLHRDLAEAFRAFTREGRRRGCFRLHPLNQLARGHHNEEVDDCGNDDERHDGIDEIADEKLARANGEYPGRKIWQAAGDADDRGDDVLH